MTKMLNQDKIQLQIVNLVCEDEHSTIWGGTRYKLWDDIWGWWPKTRVGWSHTLPQHIDGDIWRHKLITTQIIGLGSCEDNFKFEDGEFILYWSSKMSLNPCW
jgi:hypothetical protein